MLVIYSLETLLIEGIEIKLLLDITQLRPLNIYYVLNLNTLITSHFWEEIMSQDKSLKFMDFMMKLLENMEMLILGDILLMFLIIFHLEH